MSPSKPILILQLRPEDRISDSEFACFLRYGQIPQNSVRRLRIEKTGIPANLALQDYAAIIVGGSPFDISTEAARKSALQHKIESDFACLLDRVVAQDFPFLGACSGNGLLGDYLGTNISTRYGEPVSCVSVTLTEAGKQDRLLAGFPDQIEVLLGHKEACDCTPGGATLLIRGERCPVQMFRVGSNVYATQFHPEADFDEFTLRIEAYKNHGYFQPQEANRLVQSLAGKPTPYAQELLRRFVTRYCS